MPPHHEPVRPEQRFVRGRPCPVCGGCDDDTRGDGRRCFGFRSTDGGFAHCTREDRAGHLRRNGDTTYAHKLRGGCLCGHWHDDPTVTRLNVPDRNADAANGNAGDTNETASEPTSEPTNETTNEPTNETTNRDRGGSTTRFEIKDISGVVVVAIHCRRDFTNAAGEPDKTMWWTRPSGERGLGGLSVKALPLDGIHKLAETPLTEPILLVEGEKARRALTGRGIPACGTVTGAETIPDDDSLRPLVGRPVVAWPDNDEKGDRHMARIIERLRALGHDQLRRLTWTAAPDGGDAADFFARQDKPEMELIAELQVMIETAEPCPASTNASTDTKNGPSQTDQLLELTEHIELFVDQGGEIGYARMLNGAHHETWSLRSSGFRRLLTRAFYEAHHHVVHDHAFTEMLGLLEAKAQFDGGPREVFLRVGGDGDDVIYLDLANEAWESVKITAGGWSIVTDAPVRFRRSRGMLPLPTPVPGGKLTDVLEFLNVGRDPDIETFLLGHLIQSLRPHGPFQILELSGEHGSAKTCAIEVEKNLIDPSTPLTRGDVRDVRDLMIACRNGWLLPFDNLSNIPPWLSDNLCRISTGGGFSTRELRTDHDEILYDYVRPMILSGIGSVVNETDLLTRTAKVTLPQIPNRDLWDIDEWRGAFEAARPKLLGALCAAAATALRNKAKVQLAKKSRMLGAVRWIEAAAPALEWKAGRYVDAIDRSQTAAHAVALTDSPLIRPLNLLLGFSGNRWKGTASALLEKLTGYLSADLPSDPFYKLPRTWPTRPSVLSTQLRRLAPALRQVDIVIEYSDEPQLESQRRQLTVRRRVKRVPVPKEGE